VTERESIEKELKRRKAKSEEKTVFYIPGKRRLARACAFPGLEAAKLKGVGRKTEVIRYANSASTTEA